MATSHPPLVRTTSSALSDCISGLVTVVPTASLTVFNVQPGFPANAFDSSQHQTLDV